MTLNLEELKSVCRHSAQVKWDEKNYTAIVYCKWNNKEIPLAIIPFPEWHENRRCGEDEQLDRARAYAALPQLIAEVRRLREENSGLASRERVAMCIWCGSRIAAYTGHPSDMSNEEIDALIQKCREHDLNCPKNPTTQRAIHAEKKARVLAEVIQGNVYKATSCEYCPIYTKDQLKYCLDSECGKCSEYILQWAEAKAKESTRECQMKRRWGM